MKKHILFITGILLLLFSQAVQAQSYLISTYNGQTVSACTGKVFDSGDQGSGYSANENYTMTVCSGSPVNTHIKLAVLQFDVHPSDTLFVYDGNSTAAPLVGMYNNNNSLSGNAIQASVFNPTGCLTLKFKSDGALQSQGFELEIFCLPVCQTIIAQLDSINMVPMPHDSNYVDICFGDSVKFVGKGNYIQNNVVYAQSDATSTFDWNLGDGTYAHTQTVTHFYNKIRGYNVELTITDTRGCISLNALGTRVRVSSSPLGHVGSLPDICSGTDLGINVGYTSMSTINVTLPSYYQVASLSYDSATFIPDGGAIGGVCYNTNVTFNCFNPGQTVTQVSDIVEVCANMEHSFVGDLEMKLICPNGQTSVLKSFIHSGGAYLGVPLGGNNHSNFDCASPPPCIIDPLQNPPGEGWNYCWSMNPMYGLMNTYSNGAQIDSGSYQPDQGFANLIGCPLNGTWNFQVCDFWAIDNGWVFSWHLTLDQNILPVNWGYTVPIDHISWTGPWITNTGNNMITIHPDTGGTFNYQVYIADKFGCTYDTSVSVNVVTTPVLRLGNDTSLCAGNTVTLTPPDYSYGTYYWLPNGDTTHNLSITESGEYILIVQTGNGHIQCMGSDTIQVDFAPVPLISFVPDTFGGCQPVKVHFTNATKPTDATYEWDFGDGTTSSATDPDHTFILPGKYNISLKATTGAGCEESYQVNSLISVYLQPKTDFTVLDTLTTMSDPIMLTNTTLNGQFYHWDFGDEQTDTNKNVTSHSYEVPGTYTITLISFSDHGCADTAKREVIVINDSLVIPNVITPNGDMKNDNFKVTNLKYCKSNDLYIYDRWGKKVYEKHNYDGELGEWNGKDLADGTYYYVLNTRWGAPLPDQNFKGTITLLRK